MKDCNRVGEVQGRYHPVVSRQLGIDMVWELVLLRGGRRWSPRTLDHRDEGKSMIKTMIHTNEGREDRIVESRTA